MQDTSIHSLGTLATLTTSQLREMDTTGHVNRQTTQVFSLEIVPPF